MPQKLRNPSEEPYIIQQETKSGDSEKPFTGVTGDNHGQRNEEAIQQGLHQNVTIRQHRCHVLPTPRQLIREASREASTLARDDDDRPADDTHLQHTAGKENEAAQQRANEADQYDPTGQYFQHPNGKALTILVNNMTNPSVKAMLRSINGHMGTMTINTAKTKGSRTQVPKLSMTKLVNRRRKNKISSRKKRNPGILKTLSLVSRETIMDSEMKKRYNKVCTKM